MVATRKNRVDLKGILMPGTGNKVHELRTKLLELYAQGKHFDYGSLVYSYPGASKAQSEALSRLEREYGKDFEPFTLGFHMGCASFVDCMVGKKRCYRPTDDDLDFQKCVYVLLCNYTNIFVIGEHSYFGSGGEILPEFNTVDQFTTNRTRDLASEVSTLLEPAEYQRVYAAELGGDLPEQIKTESNLIGDKPLIFDGYFNWTD